MTKFPLSRRTILRGAGTAIALPLLDAMVDDRGFLTGRARAATKPPVRLLTWFWANGCRLSKWFPSAPGPLTAGTLGPQHTAFAPVSGKPDILPYLNFVGGLDNADIWKSGHNAAMFAAGAGTADDHNNFGNWPTIATIDQVCAERFGSETRFASLPMSAPGGGFGSGIPGWAILSWKEGGRQVQPYTNERTLFDTLFGGGAATPMESNKLAQRRQSVLDFIAEDATRMRSAVGAADRQRVDEHLQSIRDLEKEISATPTCTQPNRAELGTQKDTAMAKLIVMAWKCDVSRYGSFLQDYGSGQRSYGDVPGGDHNLSHDAGDDVVIRRTNTKLTFFANLLRELAAAREGDGTLLDNCVIYCNTDVSDGRTHSRTNMPVIVAGRAGGKLAAGRYIRFERQRLNDLFCSLLNYAGVDVPKYGTGGTGPLSGF